MNHKQISQNFTDTSNDLVKAYLRDITKIPVMTAQEEQEIYERILAGDESAKDRLVEGNLRFCVSIAKQYQGQGIDLMDLIEEANIGLIKSTKLFDPSKGVKFLSYAIWWIRESIIKALTNTSRSVRIPAGKINTINKLLNFIKEYEQTFEQQPSYQEIEEGTGIPSSKIVKLLGLRTKTVSLDSTINDNSELTLLDIIPNGDDEAQKYINPEGYQQLSDNLLEQLNARERVILKMFYGINCEELSLEDIGDKFGISIERVRQLRDNALKKLNKLGQNQWRNLIEGVY